MKVMLILNRQHSKSWQTWVKSGEKILLKIGECLIDGSKPKGITGGKTYQMPGWNDKDDKKQVKGV